MAIGDEKMDHFGQTQIGNYLLKKVFFGELPELRGVDNFYLAHPFEARKNVRKWELGFEKRTGINLFNPFYDGDEREDVEKADQDRRIRYEQLEIGRASCRERV